MSRRRAHVALYGAVAIRREYCTACSGTALVIDGKLACCDAPSGEDIHGVKRMTLAEGVRRKPPAAAQAEILAEQKGRCLYCEREFGTLAWRGDRPHRLRLHWDHMVPFSYTSSCTGQEFCASCHVCNQLKGARMFRSIDEARAELALERAKRGWST